MDVQLRFLLGAPLLLLLLGNSSAFRLGLSVKTADNEFFQLSHAGCRDYVRKFLNESGTCSYIGPVSSPDNWNPDPDGIMQVEQIAELLKNASVDALAISVRNPSAIHDLIRDSDIPIVTFDSDAPDSQRISYIGTDNYFLGQSMAKVAVQIHPTGGNYGLQIANESPNMLERAQGFRDYMELKNKNDKNLWRHVRTVNYERDVEVAIAQLKELANLNISVLGAMGSGAMWSDDYEETYNEIVANHHFDKEDRITMVFADDFPLQIDFLSRGKVQGLVGQMPYEMGYLAAQTLHKILMGESVPEIIGTNLITHLQVPLVLPELKVDNNLIGGLRYIGMVLFIIISVLSIFFTYWTIRNRKLPVVNSAQPFFLLLLIAGVFIMGTAIVPLSLDDGGRSISQFRATSICMSVPWVSCCGFTIAFSALYSKTFRITRILRAATTYHRVTITTYDVMLPMIILISLNMLVLTLWTVLDPLIYIRQDNPGTDGWNRTISTFGACRSNNVVPFLLPLVTINLFCVGIANWQAFVARKIKSQFAESKYIGISLAVFLQTMLIGLPVVFIVRDSPQAFYLTLCFILFVVCVMLLLLIFIPKLVLAEQDEATQLQAVQAAIRSSLPGRTTDFGLRQRTLHAVKEMNKSKEDQPEAIAHSPHDESRTHSGSGADCSETDTSAALRY